MDGEGFIFEVPCCSSFQPSDIGSMPELSLGVASNILIVIGFLQEQFMLFGRALSIECDL